jgi:hypothetical protein
MKTSKKLLGLAAAAAAATVCVIFMDNGRLPDRVSQALIKGICENDVGRSRWPTSIESHSACVDKAIFLQKLQTCPRSNGASKILILTNSSAGRQCTKISAQISGGVRRTGDSSTL